eukprot:jgi/Psemu1/9554/gm1.9554_g
MKTKRRHAVNVITTINGHLLRKFLISSIPEFTNINDDLNKRIFCCFTTSSARRIPTETASPHYCKHAGTILVLYLPILTEISNFLDARRLQRLSTTTNTVNIFSLPLHVTGTSYLIENDSPSLMPTRRYHSGPLSPNIDRDIKLSLTQATFISTVLVIHTTILIEAVPRKQDILCEPDRDCQSPRTERDIELALHDDNYGSKDCWTRISRDATTFPILHNNAQFEHWLVKFKAQLDANGINTTTFLDPYWPDNALTGYPKALYDKQCAFFWTLLRHVFQGDFSSSCVLYHQGTRDGRQAYFDFVKFHNPVSPPTPPAAPVVSSPGPVPVRPPAVGNIVMPRPTPPVSPLTSIPIPSSTPTVHQRTPTSACETDVHSTVDNPETPTGLPGSSNPGSTADSTSTGTSTYTWKDVPSKGNRKPHSTRTREPHSTRTPNSCWTFDPQSATMVFHRARSAPQPSCISSLQLPPSGASSKDSVVPSSVTKPLYGASYCPIRKFLYGARKPLYGASFSPVRQSSAYPVWKPRYEAHSMTYDLPAVCIIKRHRDAIKLKLYHLHATLLFANWIYNNVT